MSSSSTALIRRLAIVGMPLIAAGVLTAACSSSSGGGGGSSTPPSGTTAAGGSPHAAIMVSAGHLVDGAGRTVYLFAADPRGVSKCTGACAVYWSPVTPAGSPSASGGASAAKLTVVARTGGGTQLAYAGHPLYYFKGDSAAGAANGQGLDDFGAKWWEIDTAGHAVKSGSAPSNASSSSSSSSGGGGYVY